MNTLIQLDTQVVPNIGEISLTAIRNLVLEEIRVAIEYLPRPHKNTPAEFYMKKKPQKAQNIAV